MGIENYILGEGAKYARGTGMEPRMRETGMEPCMFKRRGWSRVWARDGWCMSKDPVNGGYWITASPLKPQLSTKTSTHSKGGRCGGKES